MKTERIVSSETSELKAQTSGDYPKETIRQDQLYLRRRRAGVELATNCEETLKF